MLDDFPVHAWTRRWWESLPQAYRALDATQYLPDTLLQVGLNRDPLFTEGLTYWTSEAVEQTSEQVSVRFTATFFNAAAGKDVYFQLWWSDPTPGAFINLRLDETFGRTRVEQTFTTFTGTSGMESIILTTPTAGPTTVTATFDIGGPATGYEILKVDAVNVGYRSVLYEALPGVIENPAYPLLRFMDGPGRIGGEMRTISDDLWAGKYANPATVPDTALRWLAQMLGVASTQRALPPDQLRAYLQDLTQSDRKATGTRSAITEVAKRYLNGRKQVQVGPSTSAAHTIIVLVREDEVPGNDLAALAAKIKASGVVPAGHVVIARSAAPTWAQWETATGTTWNAFEQTVDTYSDSDSAGVVLE